MNVGVGNSKRKAICYNFKIMGGYLFLITLILFVWYMNKFQIKPEEVLLTSIFGNDYIRYKQSVRRWL
nr:hypothetical protein BCU57_08805 [Shewanella sp. 10N.286.48.B5]